MTPFLAQLRTALQRILRSDQRTVLVLLVLLVFLFLGTAAAVSRPPDQHSLTPTPLGLTNSSPIEPTPSPLPRELQENQAQTIGPTIAATLLILIVIVGVSRVLLPSKPGDR